MIPATERQRRREAVWGFVFAAVSGDVPGFLANLQALNWQGCFRDVFAELVPIGQVAPDIRTAFLLAWRGENDQTGVPALGIDWKLGIDLEDDPTLYAQGLKLLTPAYQGTEPPAVLYRGQSLAAHHQGQHGIWWTPYPHIAEWFARSEIRDHTGSRCVLAVLDPAKAIIAQLCDEEFLLDPAQIDRVQLVMTPPGYSAEEEWEPLGDTSLLDKVPHGYARAAVSEWAERSARAAA